MERSWRGFFRDRRVRWTLLAAGITGVSAYGYGMLNNLVNYDSAYNLPALGIGSEVSGRWTLGLLTRLTQWLGANYSLPFFNIGLSLVLLALTAVLLTRVLRLRDPRACALAGMAVAAYPAVASMTFFSYTMPYYAAALLLITGAALLTERRRKPLWFLAYSLLLALAVGVYQAFYPYAVMLAVLCTAAECLDPASAPGTVLKRGLLYVGAILLSYLWYRLGLSAVLALTGHKLTAYQGIDRMGQIDPARLPGMLVEMYRRFFLLFTEDYLSLTPGPLTRLCVLLLLLASALMPLLGWGEKSPLKRLELAALLLLALPVASNLIILMVPEGTVYTLMGMGLLSVFLLPILLWDRLGFPRPGLRRFFGGALAALLLLSSLAYVYRTNGCYRVLEWRNIQTEHYYNTLFTRIKSAPGYEAGLPVLFAGELIEDASYRNPWADSGFDCGGLLQFDSRDPENRGFNEYSRLRFIQNYLGYSARQLRAVELDRFGAALAEMPCYPADGSIRVTERAVLVKFSPLP